MSKFKSSEKGNAMILILVGVALFAALSFAISSGSRQTSQMDEKERARLHASEIVSFGNSVKLVVEQMRMLKGVSDINDDNYGVLFSSPMASSEYGAYGAQPETELFHHEGGKVGYQKPTEDACINKSDCVYEFTGQINIKDIGSDTKSELSMVVMGLKEEVCEQINDITGYDWSDIPQGADFTLERFSGENYGDLDMIEVKIAGTANELDGKQSFCYKELNGLQRYVFVHIINAR